MGNLSNSSFLFFCIFIPLLISPEPLKLQHSNFQRRQTWHSFTWVWNCRWIGPLMTPWEAPKLEEILEITTIFGRRKMSSNINLAFWNYYTGASPGSTKKFMGLGIPELGFIFTALHVMHTRYRDENSVCPSVCDTGRELWQNGKRSVQIFIPYER